MTDERTYFAKVEDGVVTSVNVVEWDFLVANPERYGDPDLWLEVFPDGSGRGYCGVGWCYNADTDSFFVPVME